MCSGEKFFRRTLFPVIIICTLAATSDAQYEDATAREFKCSTEGATCLALVDHRLSEGTYGDIQTLFNVSDFRDILSVNTRLSVSPNDTVIPHQRIRIPFYCQCQNGLGTSINGPFYKILEGDTFYRIGVDVFSNIVKYPQIQRANNNLNPTNLSIGQMVRIPQPCSCDQVDGTVLVHYGRVLEDISVSSLEEMAQKSGVTLETIKDLNNISADREFQAGEIYDVPLRACSSSMVTNDSLDYPLRVPEDSHIYTANGCVRCQCQDSMNMGILQCEPSGLKPTNWSTCPSMQCKESNLSIGQSTMADSCDILTTCEYAGHGNEIIFTSLVTHAVDSICPGSKLWIWLTAVGGFIGILLLCYLCLVIWRKCLSKVDRIIKRTVLINEIGGRTAASIFYDMAKGHGKNHNTDDGIQTFSFKTIDTATQNFSVENKLGEGGFGPVYKGKLLNGQEIAIKRLFKRSKQGLVEFKNEAKLIANLQHNSLVKLLGFCVEREERILVYEYMANKSLNFYLFDSEKRKILDWRKSFNIIEGIAQGLVYLHTYSRIIVIHRDLKAGNVLLDNKMNPKISDFGMAKIFELKGKEEKAKQIAGTRGYMVPEYIKNGIVSLKTDVFSFGVLVLEIISGKRNQYSYDSDSPLNLIGLAWKLWNEGKGIEIMDRSLLESCITDEVRRCIQVGLVCVQDSAADRPSMSEVISMLSNENVLLPNPKPPAFYINVASDEPNGSAESQNACSINEVTISVMVAR